MRHLLNAQVVAVSALFVAALQARSVSAQDFEPLFNGKGLKGWNAEYVAAVDQFDAIRIVAGSGWLRTERVFADFVLTLEMRLLSEDVKAGVFVRAWPTFNPDSTPNNGYQITLGTNELGGFAAASMWRRVEIECTGPSVTVRVEGSAVHTTGGIENPQGHIALWARPGSAEFRDIRVKVVSVPTAAVPAGVFSMDDVQRKPTVRRDVKPSYTAAAMGGKIQGAVSMAVVILPDGTVGDVSILRSLDPKYGLDEAAVAAAKQWRFDPAVRDGELVPVAATIELSFRLK